MTVVISDRAPMTAVAYHGYRLVAPGFDADTFEEVIARALRDGLRLRPGPKPGTYIVMNPVRRQEYMVSDGAACTCPAGRPLQTRCNHAPGRGDHADHHIRGP